MNKTASIVSGIVLVIGCITLGISLIIASFAPTVFEVYLTANPVSFSHDVLKPNMIAPYVFSAVEIAAGLAGMLYWG